MISIQDIVIHGGLGSFNQRFFPAGIIHINTPLYPETQAILIKRLLSEEFITDTWERLGIAPTYLIFDQSNWHLLEIKDHEKGIIKPIHVSDEEKEIYLQLQKFTENQDDCVSLEEKNQSFSIHVFRTIINSDKKRNHGILKILNQLHPKASPVADIIDLITNIARLAQSFDATDQKIIRCITTEYSFYLKERALSLDEYKEIIRSVSDIAEKLPANIHLLLATFPVLWTDNTIHNSALYVVSPSPHETRKIFHFSKQHLAEFIILNPESGERYLFGSDSIDDPSKDNPKIVLAKTEVNHDELTQYNSAFLCKTTTEEMLMVTVGICADHYHGIEYTHAQKLIEKRRRTGDNISSVYCSQVVTSASASICPQKVISTLTHADINAMNVPEKHGIATELSSTFSSTLNAEILPSQLINSFACSEPESLTASKNTMFNSPTSSAKPLNTAHKLLCFIHRF